jgi:hypothetical protein
MTCSFHAKYTRGITDVFEDKAQPIRYVMPLNGNYFNDVDNIKK